jgi:hypothetical protein
MPGRNTPEATRLDDNDALRAILTGTMDETGERFSEALVENLALATSWRDAWISEYLPNTMSLRTLAIWTGGYAGG